MMNIYIEKVICLCVSHILFVTYTHPAHIGANPYVRICVGQTHYGMFVPLHTMGRTLILGEMLLAECPEPCSC
jgi:hypothetical protein